MFTGLIQSIGKLIAIEDDPAGKRLTIEAPLSEHLQFGESVAVNGVCLTVELFGKGTFEVVAIPETLACTNLGMLETGCRVNLERALQVGDRLGGHFVQGHVDGVGEVVEFRKQGDDVRLFVEIPAALRRFVAEKGSIAFSGVSLTVASVSYSGLKDASNSVLIEVALIPHTLAHTTLGELQEGDHVNLEVDLLARYLEVGRMNPR